MQNAPSKHSAILSTFIKLPFVIKTFWVAVLDRFYCIVQYIQYDMQIYFM